jgi:chromosome segregation ATPase
MPVTFGRNPEHVQSVDWLFGHLTGKLTGPGLPAEIFQAPISQGSVAPAGPVDYAGPQEPPTLENPADVQAAYDWLQTEKGRLEEYTRSQFALIRQQHEAAMGKHFRQEEALTLRAQELNREMNFLAAQTEALQQRGRELNDWEVALTQQTEQFSQAQKELIHIQETSKNLQRDTAAQRAYLEELQAGTARRQAAARSARAEFDNFETMLKERQQAWEKKQDEISTRQAQMEQRYQALEKAEEAVKRRMRELDELEDRLHQEFEVQQQQLSRDRRQIAEMLIEVQGENARWGRNPNGYVPRLVAIGSGERD